MSRFRDGQGADGAFVILGKTALVRNNVLYYLVLPTTPPRDQFMHHYLRPLLPWFVAAAAGYWVFMFVSTHTPTQIDTGINHFDKYAHFIAYGLLAFALGSALTVWRGYKSRYPIWIWTLAVAYAAIDEYTQRFVDSRTPDLVDFACDATGAALGLVVLHICVLIGRTWFSLSPAITTSGAIATSRD